MESLAVIDLFAGAGGFSVGAEMAGCQTRLAVGSSPFCQTLRMNHASASVFEGSVEALTAPLIRKKAGVLASEPLIVVGGAPCQPFSKAAYSVDPGDDARYRRARAAGKQARKPRPITEARPDARRDLILEFERVIPESRATGFVFENVPSILHPRNREDFEAFRRRFERAGYLTTVVSANAVEYGVPQRRRRIFLLGANGAQPLLPRATHSEDQSTGLRPAVTAGEALAPFSSSSFAEPEERISGRWSSQLKEIPPGENYKALTAWAGHPNPTFEAETRFWNFLLKLSPDAPVVDVGRQSWAVDWAVPLAESSPANGRNGCTSELRSSVCLCWQPPRARPPDRKCRSTANGESDGAVRRRSTQQMSKRKIRSGQTKSLTALSIFSGCGGLDLGFARAGFSVVFASDADARCARSYRKNLRRRV